MQEDEFQSIHRQTAVELKVQGSRFIGEAMPVKSEAEAADRIEAVRKREHSATHHCTAYRLGVDGDSFRFNDDGEPSGTAGQPILRQIDARVLTNILVVVTRYYGGTKLGTGGLIRAYGDAAAAALDAGEFIRHVINEGVNVSFAYDDTSPAMHTIDRFGAEIVETRYSEKTEIRLAVRRTQVEEFIRAFVEALGGRGSAERWRDG